MHAGHRESDEDELATLSNSFKRCRLRATVQFQGAKPDSVEPVLKGTDLVARLQMCRQWLDQPHTPAEWLPAAVAVRKLSWSDDEPPLGVILDTGLATSLARLLAIPWNCEDHNNTNNTLSIECAWTLTNLAAGTTQQCAFVVATGCVTSALELLSNPASSLALKTQLLWLLANIAGDETPANRESIVSNHITGRPGRINALQVLLPLIRGTSSSHTVQEIETLRLGLWCLHNLYFRTPSRTLRYFATQSPEAHLLVVSSLLQTLSLVDDSEALADVCRCLLALTQDYVGESDDEADDLVVSDDYNLRINQHCHVLIQNFWSEQENDSASRCLARRLVSLMDHASLSIHTKGRVTALATSLLRRQQLWTLKSANAQVASGFVSCVALHVQRSARQVRRRAFIILRLLLAAPDLAIQRLYLCSLFQEDVPNQLVQLLCKEEEEDDENDDLTEEDGQTIMEDRDHDRARSNPPFGLVDQATLTGTTAEWNPCKLLLMLLASPALDTAQAEALTIDHHSVTCHNLLVLASRVLMLGLQQVHDMHESDDWHGHELMTLAVDGISRAWTLSDAAIGSSSTASVVRVLTELVTRIRSGHMPHDASHAAMLRTLLLTAQRALSLVPSRIEW